MNRMPKAPKIDRPVEYRDANGDLCVIPVAEANKRLAALRRSPTGNEFDKRRAAREEKAMFADLERYVAHGCNTLEYVRRFEQGRHLRHT